MISRQKKALEAYRAILSWIHRKHLRVGEKIPAQIPLGQELNISQGTLGTAMQWLTEDQVLDRRQKAGTVVRSLWPRNPHRRIWTAGIVMPEFGETGYHAALTIELHRELARRHFSDRTYFISPHSMPSSEVDVRHPSDFLGLEDDLKEGLVDALLTSTRLSFDAIPCVATGSDARSMLRVIRDQAFFYESSVRELHARGNRRIFILGASRDDLAISRRTAGLLSPEVEIREIAVPSITEWAVEAAATQVLSADSLNDCSGLIISDDLAAAIFSHRIALGSIHRPVICLQTYGASLLSYFLPVIKYITDLRALSVAAVNMIVERLLNLSTGRAEVRLPLTLKEVPLPVFPQTRHIAASAPEFPRSDS